MLKKGGCYLFLKLKVFCILTISPGNSTYEGLQFNVKTVNAFLSFQVGKLSSLQKRRKQEES